MRNRISIHEHNVADNQSDSFLNVIHDAPFRVSRKDASYRIFADEGREHFFNYVDWLGLAKDQKMVVLSSRHHYYYDAEEMKSVRTVVNLKDLNNIRQAKKFIHSIFHIMNPKSYFVGCFVDNKKQSGNGLKDKPSDYHPEKESVAVQNNVSSRSSFLNMLLSFMDSKTNNSLSRRDVTLLLGDCGFKVLDMTELDGITYFCAQKLLPAAN